MMPKPLLLLKVTHLVKKEVILIVFDPNLFFNCIFFLKNDRPLSIFSLYFSREKASAPIYFEVEGTSLHLKTLTRRLQFYPGYTVYYTSYTVFFISTTSISTINLSFSEKLSTTSSLLLFSI